MRAALIACLLSAASPAFAQTASTTGATPPARVMSIVAEVAPQWATPTPWDYDEITDSTAVSLTLTAKPKISDAVEVELSAGPKATLDDDHDNPGGAESAFGFGATVRVPASLGLKLFGSAAYDKRFTNFFDEGNGSKRTVSAGLEFGYDIPRSAANKKVPRLSASAALGLVNATDDAVDHSFAQLKTGFGIPLWWFGKFDVEANGARRWLEHANATAGFKERRTEWGASIGVNFARGVMVWTGGNPDDNPWLRKFKIGYNFFKRESNIPGADKTSSSPSLSLAIGQDF